MIEYHADDYGLFPEQSRHIMECYHKGALNGISIMPNSPYLKECMDEISDVRENLFVTVHLNFVEGKPISGSKANKLTDANGNFNCGFAKLLAVSYNPFLRRVYYKQIRREVETQLRACEEYMNGGVFRIDGHVHYHMIPIVFDALMDVIKSCGFRVSYIRFPYEEVSVYAKNIGKLKGLTAINFVKVMILNALVKRNKRKYSSQLADLGVEDKLFMGVMLSGHMFYENVKPCLKDAGDLLAKRGKDDAEILFHPGDVSVPADIERLTSKDDYEFLTSSNRMKEAEALKMFGSNLSR
ncbi:MAG: ChbG/HpnK family deacetylase [Butyrivibrio sp.]|nr:ChbG/HpnK family deacetylase [Butyrivibrio sp.]